MRNPLKTKLRLAVAAFATLTAIGLWASEPTVTDAIAKQRYPWNELVDITCKVTGINGTTNGLEFAVSAVMPDSGSARRISHFWVVRDGMNSVDRAVCTNGNYRLVWDARADLGQVICSNMVMRVTIIRHGKVQLWAGGPYWAETNIGADEPHEYGCYFWWGDVVGYKRVNDGVNDVWVASDGSSTNYSFLLSDTPTYNIDAATLKSQGWITADGVLAPEHDAAQVLWGGRWRMPTMQELSNLVCKCSWSWTKEKGVYGYRVRGWGDYYSASIFLPAAGDMAIGTALWDAGSRGRYWASVPYSWPGITSGNKEDSWCLDFDSRDHDTSQYGTRYYGCLVRPVQGFAN